MAKQSDDKATKSKKSEAAAAPVETTGAAAPKKSAKPKVVETKVEEKAAIQLTGRRVKCFVSKREIDEALAVQMVYSNGEKVWVNQALVYAVESAPTAA